MPGIDPISVGASGVASLVQAAVGVAQMVQAGKQNREAKRLAKNLIRPDYEIPQEYRDNLALAESMAGQGLSDAAMEVYKTNANNTLTSSVDAILRGGGSVNNISDLYDTAENNFASLAALEDELRFKRQQVLMDQNEQMAQQRTTQWQVNEYAPYQDQKQLIAHLRGQANNNQWAGINTVGSAVGNFAMALPWDMPTGGGNRAAASAAPDAPYFGSADGRVGVNPQMPGYAQSIQNDIYTTQLFTRFAGRGVGIQ